MKINNYLIPIIAILCLPLNSHPSEADTKDQDLSTICGWYQSLASEEQFRGYTPENKFAYAFDDTKHRAIKNMPIKMFYAALRNTDSKHRYELMQAYAKGTLGTDWQCPPMKQIMDEFHSIDPLIQYAQ